MDEEKKVIVEASSNINQKEGKKDKDEVLRNMDDNIAKIERWMDRQYNDFDIFGAFSDSIAMIANILIIVQLFLAFIADD